MLELLTHPLTLASAYLFISGLHLASQNRGPGSLEAAIRAFLWLPLLLLVPGYLTYEWVRQWRLRRSMR